MIFEHDPTKSASNKIKHGIDFEEAQALWNFPIYEFKLNYELEPRFGVIGVIGDKHWTAIITYRNGAVRIISVRRSHKQEERVYDEKIH